MAIKIKDAKDCAFDQVSLGEIMLRLDPGEGRVHTARQFTAWEGGGEYNVSRGLRRCFGLRTSVVTAFADNPVGRLIEDFILQGGVNTDFIQWKDYDGVGRDTFDASLASLRPRGVLALFGQSSGPVAPVEPQRLNAAGSVYLTRPSLEHFVADRAELLWRADDLFTLVGEGRLDVRIGGRYPLAEASAAHADLASRRTAGKLVLV